MRLTRGAAALARKTAVRGQKKLLEEGMREAGLPCSGGSVSRWCTGELCPSIAQAAWLRRRTGIPVEWFAIPFRER